jgi:excisionase family DNA binding protein
MARRYNHRRVKINRTYKVEEAAKLFGVHKQTVLRWIAAGLPLVERRKPFLIHGSDLRPFLKSQRPEKQPCKPGEIYCVRCRAPRDPLEKAVVYRALSTTHGRISGACSCCLMSIAKPVRRASLDALQAELHVTCPDADQRLADSPDLPSNVNFNTEK